jgi:hypothetical protein
MLAQSLRSLAAVYRVAGTFHNGFSKTGSLAAVSETRSGGAAEKISAGLPSPAHGVVQNHRLQ